jgi:hypothetical protein
MKGGLALAHCHLQLCRENLAAAVRRQLEVIDACHHTGQVRVAADAAVVTLSPDDSDWWFQPVQAAGWKGGISRQEAQEQAALGLAHILQHLQSRITRREMKEEGAWGKTSKSHTNGADSLPDEVLEQTLLMTIKRLAIAVIWFQTRHQVPDGERRDLKRRQFLFGFFGF